MRESVEILKSLPQTLQVGHMVALKELATKSNIRLPLHNKMSSKYVLHNLLLSFKKNEDAGFIGVPNKEIIQVTIASL